MMMPDRYDELRKRAATLGVVPSDPNSPIQISQNKTGDPRLDMDTIELEAPYKGEDNSIKEYNPEPAQPTISQRNAGMDPSSAMYLGDLAASAGPGLLSLFGGGSPAVVSNLMDKGNTYAMNRGTQEEITKKNLSVVADEDGNPIYTRTRDALGQEPYFQPKGVAANQPRRFQPIILKNVNKDSPDFKKIKGATQTSEGYFDQDGNKLNLNEWLPFKPDDLIKQRTVQGGSVVQSRDKYSGSTAPVAGQRGLGDTMGGVSKEQAQAMLKDASKSKTEKAKRIGDVENLKRIRDTLSVDSQPEEVAQGIEKLKRLAGGENRLSDIESQVFGGDKYKTYFTQAKEWASGKIGGRPNPRVVEAYKEIAQRIIDQKSAEMGAIQKNYANPDMVNTKEAKGILNAVSGGDPAIDPSRQQQLEEQMRKRGLIR